MTKFSKDELQHLAAKARLSEKQVLDTAAETVDRFKQVWAKENGNLPMAEDLVREVDAHLPHVPPCQEL